MELMQRFSAFGQFLLLGPLGFVILIKTGQWLINFTLSPFTHTFLILFDDLVGQSFLFLCKCGSHWVLCRLVITFRPPAITKSAVGFSEYLPTIGNCCLLL